MELVSVSDNLETYHDCRAGYCDRSNRNQQLLTWLKESFPMLLDAFMNHVSIAGADRMEVLGVGSADGMIETVLLKQLLVKGYPLKSITAVEPHLGSLQSYQNVLTTEPAHRELQHLDYEWRNETLDEYVRSSADSQSGGDEMGRFHFISVISVLYYCGDIEKSLKELFNRLARGGVMMIGVYPDNDMACQARWLVDEGLTTESAVQESFKKLNVPISSVHTVECDSDVTSCFEDPLTEKGRQLLSYVIQVDFASVPVERQEKVLAFIKSKVFYREGRAFLPQGLALIFVQRT